MSPAQVFEMERKILCGAALEGRSCWQQFCAVPPAPAASEQGPAPRWALQWDSDGLCCITVA